MEENQESLFGMTIDPPIKSHLSETARWAQFLGILGIILSVLCVLGGIAMVTIINTTSNEFSSGYESTYPGSMNLVGSMGMIVYLVSALMIFFPSLFMMRFAGKMKGALLANDQPLLTSSFQNLKLLFRFWGIMAIIVIAFYILLFVAIGSGWLIGSR